MHEAASIADLRALLQATWPALSALDLGPFTYRSDCGGGARVSAASLVAQEAFTESDLEAVEARFERENRDALFQVWPGDAALDAALAARGYAVKDATDCLSASTDMFQVLRDKRGFPCDPPTAAQKEIWREGGVGAARLAVMARVQCAKTALLGRLGEAPAGTCFIAVSGEAAMVHALEVSPAFRRQNLAQNMMGYAAEWAAAEGAKSLKVLVTSQNTAAQKLYLGLGMKREASYHYRMKPAVIRS